MSKLARPDGQRRQHSRQRGAFVKVFGVLLAALGLLIGAAIPAAAAELMRVTFVRHAESAGNASGVTDTSTPGPVLTPTGQQQAQAVVGVLGDNNYDGIYSSTMVRTQLTAAPMSQYLGLPIQVINGLQEIEAGDYEGKPEMETYAVYSQAVQAWAFMGNRDFRIPGSVDGNEFDARFDGALQTIYDNGDRNPVVFSHGAAIPFWTVMNAQNLTLAQKIELLGIGLKNTDYVVIEGNPEDGWTLVSWNGRLYKPEPTLGAEVQRQLRTLTRQLSTAVGQVLDAFATRNVAQIAAALNRGVADAVFSVVKFGRAVNAKVIHDLGKLFQPAPAPTVAPVDAAITATGPVKASNTARAAASIAVNDTEPTNASEASEVADDMNDRTADSETVANGTDGAEGDDPDTRVTDTKEADDADAEQSRTEGISGIKGSEDAEGTKDSRGTADADDAEGAEDSGDSRGTADADDAEGAEDSGDSRGTGDSQGSESDADSNDGDSGQRNAA